VLGSARHTRKCQTGTDSKQIKDKLVAPGSARHDSCSVKNLQIALDRADSNQALGVPGIGRQVPDNDKIMP